jgi:hypothetical protein
MRRVVAALVVCLGLAVPACASAVYVETAPEVQQELVGLRTSDGRQIKDADCRPQGTHFAVLDGDLDGSLWTCYVSDTFSRVYNVNVHVQNAKSGALDKINVLNCWPNFAQYSCPPPPRIVLPNKDNGKGKH